MDSININDVIKDIRNNKIEKYENKYLESF